MALAAATVWEIQPVAGIGNDDNGGGFVTGAAGSDYSQTARRVATGTDDSTTDVVAIGTTTITSATANFQASIVGNIISLQGGTGTLAKVWRQVTARTNSTTITVDAAVAAGTGITMNIGGPLASLGMCGASASVAGMTIHIKAGTYVTTSASTNISNGCFSRSILLYIFGYQTTRFDWGTPPLIQASGITNFTLITAGSTTGFIIGNVNLDGATLTGSRGFAIVSGIVYKCSGINCLNSAFINVGNNPVCINCIASGCTTQPAFREINICYACIAQNGTSPGFSVTVTTGVAQFNRCIADTLTGGTDGFLISVATDLSNCVAYACGRDGFRITASAVTIENCIAEDNVVIGFNALNNSPGLLWLNNAAFSNATDFVIGTGLGALNLNSIVGAGTFFTDAPNGDFSLNTLAGAALKAAGFPGVFQGGLTTGFLDIGAAQSQSSSTPAATSLVLQGSKILPYGSNYY